jgi:hypothetical protein
MAKAIQSQGVVLAMSDGGSPSLFTNVGNVTGFQGPGGSAAVIDVSNLDSTAKEKLIGLADEGQFTFDMNLDPDNAAHQALRDARATRVRKEFRLTLTDTVATVLIFYGYVLQFRIQGAVDQVVKASVSLEVDGAVNWV